MCRPRARKPVFSVSGYGFIQTPDQREIYFLCNGMTQSGVDRREIGT
jgi:hypothetical protein